MFWTPSVVMWHSKPCITYLNGGVGCAHSSQQEGGDLYGPRSLAGARTRDAMETRLSTARKLGVNFFQYIRDRFSGARQMLSLADLIRQRAKTMDLGSSWTPA